MTEAVRTSGASEGGHVRRLAFISTTISTVDGRYVVVSRVVRYA